MGCPIRKTRLERPSGVEDQVRCGKPHDQKKRETFHFVDRRYRKGSCRRAFFACFEENQHDVLVVTIANGRSYRFDDSARFAPIFPPEARESLTRSFSVFCCVKETKRERGRSRNRPACDTVWIPSLGSTRWCQPNRRYVHRPRVRLLGLDLGIPKVVRTLLGRSLHRSAVRPLGGQPVPPFRPG
ncbi:hypothetical protein FF011L_45860 [Roseimaritima multifibrata]|uniref:Uncharacterized protein n=1 Tax=Roseimaritima multifibrata TaxID=1930274 RepID=A0A517MLK5_9BACT|nr:hypothetical protein FF011L_45860 [Roseimaritima multifibrata]